MKAINVRRTQLTLRPDARPDRARPDAAGDDGIRRAGRAAAARRDEGHRRLRAHRPPRRGRPHQGPHLGADDYLPKPFSPDELVLRVGAVLRRLSAPAVAVGGQIVVGPITLDDGAHQVQVDGRHVELTATEFRLLRLLMEREGRVQTRTHLLQTVWQAQPDIQTRRGHARAAAADEAGQGRGLGRNGARRWLPAAPAPARRGRATP